MCLKNKYHVNYFKDLFESISVFRKNLILVFLIKNVDDSLTECNFLSRDNNHLRIECKNFLIDQNESYLDHMKNEEDSIIGKFLVNKWRISSQFFSMMLVMKDQFCVYYH